MNHAFIKQTALLRCVLLIGLESKQMADEQTQQTLGVKWAAISHWGALREGGDAGSR